MKKAIVGIFILTVLVINACSSRVPETQVTPPTLQTLQEPTSKGIEDPAGKQPVSAEGRDAASADEKRSAAYAPVKEFTIIARQWEFDPNEIIVKKGDNVRLKITSIDVTHGFRLPDYGINERLPVGKEVVIEFKADTEGTFPFACSVPCGSGHGRMTGILKVE